MYFPEPLPMSTAGPRIGHAVVDLLTQRGIKFHPAHQAPTVIRDSTLAKPTGFIPVDPATLDTSVQGVYAIGDATAVPIAAGKSLPKAGVFAHAQADVVARRIADELAGRSTPRRWPTRSSTRTRTWLSNWNIPRFVRCYSEDLEFLYLPRAMADKATELVAQAGSRLDITDRRADPPAIDVTFTATLRYRQPAAVADLARRSGRGRGR